jgi:hypothetical protein
MATLLSSTGRWRTLAAYALMLAATVAIYLLIRDHGSSLVSNAPPATAASEHAARIRACSPTSCCAARRDHVARARHGRPVQALAQANRR